MHDARRLSPTVLVTALAVGLIPALVPIIAAHDPRRLLYPYTAILDMVCAGVCLWMGRRSSSFLRAQWTLFALQCLLRSLSTLLPAIRAYTGWPPPAANSWSISVCVSASAVVTLLALTTMGRQLQQSDRALDIGLSSTLGFLMFLSVFSTRRSEFVQNYPVTTFLVAVFLLLVAHAAHLNATTTGELKFTSLARIYLLGRCLMLFANNVVNYTWLAKPRELPFDLLFGLPSILFLLMAVGSSRGGGQRPLPELPLLRRNLMPSMVLVGVVLMSLDVYEEHRIWAGVATLVATLFFIGRTHLLYQRMLKQQEALLRHAGQLQKLATRDELTGIGNRRWLEEMARTLLAVARPAALLLLDTDGFKQVNDNRGHQAGDDVLRDVAEALEEVAAVVDDAVCVRMGGDEFVALLPAVNVARAEEVAEQIRNGVAARTLAAGHAITVSIGVAASSDRVELSSLLQLADEALYRAKFRGRNVVEVTPEDASYLEPLSTRTQQRRFR